MATTTEKVKTRSQLVAADVAAALRARQPLIWIVSREEARVERYLAAAASAARYAVAAWDVAAGLTDAAGAPMKAEGAEDPGVALDFIRDYDGAPTAWIMRDLPSWLGGPGAAKTLRQMRNLVRALPTAPPERAQSVVVLSPGADVPPELANHATVIEWPLPDRAEIGEVLDEAVAAQGGRAEPLGAGRDAAVDAAVGLTEEEALACVGRSLVQLKRVDPVAVAMEKRRVIARERFLEWHDPLPGGLDAVGGLENVKAWLKRRRAAFSQSARAYGLPLPKGLMVVGVPGTGKSLLCKAIGTAFGCPLIRLDLGALKSKFVGDSEANIRRVIKVIEALGLCVVWIDEVEKGLQGASSGSSDGGTSADQLGALLSWMQEQKSGAFVVATANDVSALPPEFLRKGRFDELFFVDLPTRAERAQIAAATLRTLKRDPALVDCAAVAAATDGFTGAEIAAVVPEAMFAAFDDGAREITTGDVVAAAEEVVPLSKTAGEKIKRLREWGAVNARPAGIPEERAPERRVRALDI